MGNRKVRECGMDMDTQLYSKCRTKKDLLQHREPCSGLCGSLDGRGVWGRMGTCVWMAESLHSSPETVTTLFISCTPIENKKVRKERRLSELTALYLHVAPPSTSAPLKLPFFAP